MASKKRTTRKTSGDGQPAGDWTQSGDGTDYPEETSKYITLRPVHHDGELYPAGSEIFLTDDAADMLLAQQAVTDTVEVSIN